MNKIPSILVDTGFEVDQNGILTELDVPNVVDTLNSPSKINFQGVTLNWVPSNRTTLSEINAPNCTSIPDSAFLGFSALTTANLSKITAMSSTKAYSGATGGVFYGCTNLMSVNVSSLVTIYDKVSTGSESGAFFGCVNLSSISLPSLTSIYTYVGNFKSGAFYGCIGLTSIDAPLLEVITTDAISNNSQTGGGAFYGCTSLTSVMLPSLRTLDGSSTAVNGAAGAFWGCTSLTSVTLPLLNTCNDTVAYKATFGNCTSLETVQLGSEGHTVTSLGAYMFKNCTQSNLTITIYTADGNALANSPFGATNATIIWEEA